MTKLMEWVTVLIVLLSVYLSIITGQIKSKLFDAWMFQIQIFPIIAVGMFGVSSIHSHRILFSVKTKSSNGVFITFLQLYSVFIILYRVFTFNDCPEAADEIQKQIEEAKADLKTKGLKF